MHLRYFARIAHNTDARIAWPPGEWAALRAQLRRDGYEAALRERLRRAAPLVSLGELRRDRIHAAATGNRSALVRPLALWYTHPPRAEAVPDGTVGLFSRLADLLGLWHEIRRGSHDGVHELSCAGRPLMLVNTLVGPEAGPSPYATLAPPSEAVFTADRLRRAVERLGPRAGQLCGVRRAGGST